MDPRTLHDDAPPGTGQPPDDSVQSWATRVMVMKEMWFHLKTFKKKSPFLNSSSFIFFLTQSLRLKCTFLNRQINETEKSTDSSSQRLYYANFRNRSSGGFYVNK